jgi:hypothetical protein
MTTFAFSHRKRPTTRRQHYEYEPPLTSVESVAVLVSGFAAVAMVVAFADPTQSMLVAEAELVLLLVSIPVALLRWPVLACALHAAAQVLYIDSRVKGAGFSLQFFTHWSITATLVLTVLIGLLSGVSYMLYTCGSRRLYAQPVEKLTAMCLTALVSVQFFLTLGTLGMAAGYTGAAYHSGAYGWRSTGYQYTTQHTISFFFAAAIFAVRYEHDGLFLTTRRAAWFTLPPLLGVAWFVCVLALSTAHADPYTVFVDAASFVIGVSAAAIAWVGCGVFLHV